jgi:hypothetical protein
MDTRQVVARFEAERHALALPAPLPMIDEPITERAGTVIGPSRASRCAQRPRRSGRCCSVP